MGPGKPGKSWNFISTSPGLEKDHRYWKVLKIFLTQGIQFLEFCMSKMYFRPEGELILNSWE